MALSRYVGARYVPKFADPVNWSADKTYEALEIVTYNDVSYTSKKPVPSNQTPPDQNTEYWVLTGNYNSDYAAFKNTISDKVAKNTADISDLKSNTATDAVVKQLRTDVDKNTNDIKTINSTLSTHGTNISDLQNTTTGLRTDIDSLGNQVTENQRNIGTNTSNISVLNTRVTALENYVEELEDTISKLIYHMAHTPN